MPDELSAGHRAGRKQGSWTPRTWSCRRRGRWCPCWCGPRVIRNPQSHIIGDSFCLNIPHQQRNRPAPNTEHPSNNKEILCRENTRFLRGGLTTMGKFHPGTKPDMLSRHGGCWLERFLANLSKTEMGPASSCWSVWCPYTPKLKP